MHAASVARTIHGGVVRDDAASFPSFPLVPVPGLVGSILDVSVHGLRHGRPRPRGQKKKKNGFSVL